MAGHAIVPTGEGDLFFFERALDDRDRLGRLLDPGFSRIEL